MTAKERPANVLRVMGANMLCGLMTAFFLMLPLPAMAESFICMADLSTGFWWSGREWQQATFTVKDDRYLVEELPPQSSGRYNYAVKKVGADGILHNCTRDLLSDGRRTDRIVCGGQAMGFLMDVKTLRFQDLYGIGFVDGGDSTTNTPSLTIGKCTRLR